MTRKTPTDPTTTSGPSRCSCGQHASEFAHDTAASEDARLQSIVEAAVMRAAFPDPLARRRFLSVVGTATAAAALAHVFPIGLTTEVLAQTAKPEKDKLKIGFIPITCATPIILAAPMGFYSKQGLDVEVIKTAGWAVIRDKTINKEYDAAHMLSPMPLAITLGAGSNPIPYTMPAVENINGQAITLAMKHKDKRDPKTWKGFKFAVPFDYSMHNYLLRYYLAEHGIDPDKDVQIRSVPPPEMVANLRADNIDGFLGPDPFNQRAVFDGAGFIHILSKELWDGHPCCAFAASREFVTTLPNTYQALLKAIINATAFASKAENRKQIAEAIAPANYLNQPVTVLEQILTGTYADGLGNIKKDPNSRRLRSVSLGEFRGLDAHPDEALGPDQGRRRLRRGRPPGLSRHRRHAPDEGSRHDAADLDVEVVQGDGQGVRSVQAGGLSVLLRDQAELSR